MKVNLETPNNGDFFLFMAASVSNLALALLLLDAQYSHVAILIFLRDTKMNLETLNTNRLTLAGIAA